MTKHHLPFLKLALAFAFAAGLAAGANAQDVKFYASAERFTPLAGANADVVLSGSDVALLDNMSTSWWRALRREHVAALDAPSANTRGQSLQNIVFLATNYSKQSGFDRSVHEVYHTYRFDRDERVRIMALSALCAIGDEDVLRQMARDVRLEGNPRVRRMTVNALGAYFHVNDR